LQRLSDPGGITPSHEADEDDITAELREDSRGVASFAAGLSRDAAASLYSARAESVNFQDSVESQIR
jgi:hypothetical protein